MTPIRRILARIDAIATPDDVVRHLREEFAAGSGNGFHPSCFAAASKMTPEVSPRKGTAPVAIGTITLSGANAGEFAPSGNCALAVLAPWLSPHDPYAQQLLATNGRAFKGQGSHLLLVTVRLDWALVPLAATADKSAI